MACTLQWRKCVSNALKLNCYPQLSFQSSINNSFFKSSAEHCRNVRLFSWRVRQSGSNAQRGRSLINFSALTGTVALVGYLVYKKIYVSPVVYADKEIDINGITPSRSIVNEQDKSGLKLVLYQYQTCPFCCKVRAYFDYLGISYDVVEVNPVLRQQIKFSKWRKVPVVLVRDQKNQQQQLNDSSMIISFLQSYLLDKSRDLDELITFYPLHTYENEDKKVVKEVINRYFIMYGDKIKSNRTDKDIEEERKWRIWVDNNLVHVLSPNIYRSPGEALQAFKWFSQVGEWDKHFPLWERLMVVYIGATAMYFVGKRLKKRHLLEDDVRVSLYDACNQWTTAIGSTKPFMGGNSPNLADLAVYGVLNAIEGCVAFKDLLQNTKIERWYYEMKDTVNSHSGLKDITI